MTPREAEKEIHVVLRAGGPNPATFAKAVELLKLCAIDDEIAHGLEDEIRDLALTAISCETDAKRSAAIALAVLKTGELGFSRWCA